MTRVVVTIVPGDAWTVVGDQARFHLAAGADAVLVGTTDAGRATMPGDLLGDDPRAVAVHVDGARPRRDLARAAISEHGAEWVLDARDGEFWWPRGESFRDILGPMPARYGVVQGLVRAFAGPEPGDGPVWERTTARRSLLVHPRSPDEPVAALLRPVYRAHPELDPDLPAGGGGTRQPLRAWYPLEVLTLPAADAPADAEALARGLADGRLVRDERLRDALATIASGGVPAFPIPGVVDDAGYAGECAAVGEVDLDALDRQLRALESRVAELEARFWPRVQRVLARVARRARP